MLKNFNSRLHQAEETISELEDRTFEIIQSDKNEEKRIKKEWIKPLRFLGLQEVTELMNYWYFRRGREIRRFGKHI